MASITHTLTVAFGHITDSYLYFRVASWLQRSGLHLGCYALSERAMAR